MRSSGIRSWLRPLLDREYAQARLFVFAVPIVHFLTLGMTRMNQWFWSDMGADLQNRMQDNAFAHDDLYRYIYDSGSHEVTGRMWLLLAVFVLALVQLGVERRNGSQELLFSMPYPRSRIFLSKWLLGAMLVAGSLLLNTLIDAFVLVVSPASAFFRADYYAVEFGYSLLVILAGYTSVLLVGTVTGSVASQTVLTWMLAAFPIAFIALLDISLQVQGIYITRHRDTANSYTPLWGDRVQEWFNFAGYVSADYMAITWAKTLFMLALLVVTFALGMLAYSRNRTENNGKLMLFKSGETVMRFGIVLCVAMMAGMLGSELLRHSAGERLGYDIGFVVGCVISAIGIRKLLRMRFKY